MIDFSKAPVDGKRPGDVFTRQGVRNGVRCMDEYRVIAVVASPKRDGLLPRVQREIITESVYGRERWF